MSTAGIAERGEADPKFAKLKPGPGRSAQEVRENQRTRLRRAVIQLASERGPEGVTVRSLSKLAGVSTATFYSHFKNTDECFGKTCESTMDCALEQMTALCADSPDWEARIRCGVDALLRFVARRPSAARLVLVEVAALGPENRQWLDRSGRKFELALVDLIPGLGGRVDVGERLATAMLAGVTRVLRATTIAGRADELPSLAGELADWLVGVSTIEVPVVSSRSSPGRHRDREPKVTRAEVRPPRPVSVADDRKMIVKATVKLASKGGYASLTVPRIRSAAGVSRRCFNRYFSDARDCFLQSVEWLAIEAASCSLSHAKRDGGAEPSIRQLILALLRQVARSEPLAGLVFVDVRDAGRDGLFAEERLVSMAAAALERKRSIDEQAPTVGAEATVAALWRVIAGEVLEGRTTHLPRLASGLAELAGVSGGSTSLCWAGA